MTPPQNLVRPIQFNSPGAVVDAIRRGRYFDGSLDAIIDAANERKEQKRREVLAAVKAEFGPSAEIVAGGSADPRRYR